MVKLVKSDRVPGLLMREFPEDPYYDYMDRQLEERMVCEGVKLAPRKDGQSMYDGFCHANDCACNQCWGDKRRY